MFAPVNSSVLATHLGQYPRFPSYDTGEEGTQVVSAHNEALRGQEDKAVLFLSMLAVNFGGDA